MFLWFVVENWARYLEILLLSVAKWKASWGKPSSRLPFCLLSGGVEGTNLTLRATSKLPKKLFPTLEADLKSKNDLPLLFLVVE